MMQWRGKLSGEKVNEEIDEFWVKENNGNDDGGKHERLVDGFERENNNDSLMRRIREKRKRKN